MGWAIWRGTPRPGQLIQVAIDAPDEEIRTYTSWERIVDLPDLKIDVRRSASQMWWIAVRKETKP